MATSGALADFARMPTQRKVLVFVVAGMLLGLLYFRFVLSSLNEELTQAEQAYQTSVQNERRLTENLPKFEALKKERTELNEMISRNQKALPTEAEMPAFFDTLERKVRESGVEITKWTKRPEEQVETFVKVPVEYEIVGTFMQIKRFFWSLLPREPEAGGRAVDRDRIVSIEGLQLTNPTLRNREVVLSAKFTAVTFRQADPAAATGPRPPGGAPAARPNPNLKPPAELAPSGGAAPLPTPSATTKPGDGSARLKDGIQ